MTAQGRPTFGVDRIPDAWPDTDEDGELLGPEAQAEADRQVALSIEWAKATGVRCGGIIVHGPGEPEG